jgi:DNA polymerase III sliding clamp (beta) subunit (PCNA family)
MKTISLPIAELKPALTGLSKVINLKSTLPVLQHIKVERTSEGWIALTGTDLDSFATMRFEHPAEGPATAVLIPYDQLLQITKNCGKNEHLHIESTPDGPLIKFALADKFGESKVKPIPMEQFPQSPQIKADAFPLPPELRRSIHEAMDCASVDSTRYVLNGTFIDTSNPKANYIVGTDGRHLYSANSFTLPLKNSVIIPNHRFLEWKEFNADGEWQMKVDDKTVQLSSRRWRFISKQIEGNYPDWRAPIPNPNDAKTNIIIAPAKLETLIKLIQRMPCHDDEKFRTIGLEWSQSQFRLLGKDTPEEPWLRVPVPDVTGEGPEVTIFLDRRYLIKALEFGLNSISLTDPIASLRFHSQGRQMIVMPLRPDADQNQPYTTQQRAHVTAITAPSAAAQPQPTPPMQTQTPIQESTPPAGTNGSFNTTNKLDTKPALEAALVQVENLKTGFREGINNLTKLGDSIRHAMREQKASEKEVHSVRQTLRSLQGVRI